MYAFFTVVAPVVVTVTILAATFSVLFGKTYVAV